MAAELLTAPAGVASGAETSAELGHPDQPVFTYGYSYEPPPKGRLARLVDRLPRWAAPAGLTLLLSGGVGYTLLMQPTTTSASDIPTCAVKLFTGFDCPGCGGTRAAWYLLHGDIPAAAHHHALMVFATPFLAYLFVSWALGRLTNRTILPKFRLSNGAMIGFLIAWLVFSVVRNLPWAPFDWLFI
jgi:hypothetical protein